MKAAQFFVAIGVNLCLAVIARGQVGPSGALTGELRAHIENDRFAIVTSIRGLPLGVRSGLQTLFGGHTLDLAEPGAAFQVGEKSVSSLPTRRLVAAGCSYHDCLVYYERGGNTRRWHVVLFHWTPEATKFEWGSTAPGGLSTIDDVRKAILSGAIKGPGSGW